MPEILPVRKTDTIFDELRTMQEKIMSRAFEIFRGNGDIFGRDLDNWLAAERALVWKPAIELEETEKEFKLKVAVPGVEPRELDIEVTPDDFLVKAEVQHEHKKDKGKVHTCEFVSNNLFRAVHFPRKVNPEKVRAEFKNGILYVTAEIAEEAKAKKVKIEAA
jgi:HSP20 family protein